MSDTAGFFDEMARRYDSDLVELGWDPVALVERWPFSIPVGASVLDAGCGTGAVLERLAGADRKLHGFDLSPEMVRMARRRRSVRDAEVRVAGAGDEWPFPDAAFDRVLVLAMLEFVERLDRALDELARVMRPGARALVTVEDVVDAAGIGREAFELRYGQVAIWRRTREELEMCVPPGCDVVRWERVPAYTVLERGFTCAYHAVEIVRR